MTYAARLVQANPNRPYVDANALAECIQACYDCAQACIADADADLGEQQGPEMLRCIRLCLDCAEVCDATGRIVTRQTEPNLGVVRAAVEACATTCRACGDECERHAPHHEHCRISAEVCRRCEQACRDLLATMG